MEAEIREMKQIEIDATSWVKVGDFYEAILSAIGAPDWHGRSIDALCDSMIVGGINEVEAPYSLRLSGLDSIPYEVSDQVVAALDHIGTIVRDQSSPKCPTWVIKNAQFNSPAPSTPASE